MSFFNESFVEPSCFFGLCNQGANGRISFPEQPISQHQQNGIHVAAEDKQDKEELDALLSQAMNTLTFEERQEQQEILHGVDRVVEDDAFMDRALQDLDNYLVTKMHEAQSAYYMAERLDPEYVRDRAFRVMFLRANEYDPEATGDQMLRHFDLKLQLFGEEKLTKNITMGDLDESDIAYLKQGFTQLAGRDTSGRQVFITIAGLVRRTETVTMQNYKRALFFIIMTALKSEETQIRGTVAIWYAIGEMRNKSNGRDFPEAFRTSRALPQKRSAIHFCVDEIHKAILINALLKVMPRNMRARFKIHFGSQMECQYQLSSYGVLKESWPFDENGRMKMERHLNWVHRCAREELSQSPSPTSFLVHGEDPGPNDVLYTNGYTRNHGGTMRFRDLVDKYFGTYCHCLTHESKRQIVDEIIERIHETGGRFLTQTGNSTTLWEEVARDEVRKKIMQTFRNRRRRRDDYKQTTCGTLIVGNPLPHDVVCGRNVRNIGGSDSLHSLIKRNFEEYQSLERGKKLLLVKTIMQNIIDKGGRFLIPSEEQPDQWLELSYDDARDRISKSFRNQRRYATTR